MEAVEKETMTPEIENLLGDILSHAITGEIIGMQNFASMVALFPDWKDKIEAVEHAKSEKNHALVFQKIAANNEIEVQVNPEGTYWKKISAHFEKYVVEKNLLACIIAQEIIFESMAVALYDETGKALGGPIGEVFLQVAEEEKSHGSHSLDELKEYLSVDREIFFQTAKRVNDEIMGSLSEMLAPEDHSGHCGICNGNCIKGNLHHLKLSITELRGRTLNLYLQKLDEIGLPGDETLKWVANLPL